MRARLQTTPMRVVVVVLCWCLGFLSLSAGALVNSMPSSVSHSCSLEASPRKEQPLSGSSGIQAVHDHDENKRPVTQWLTCTSINELRQAVETHVFPDDVVAELGSESLLRNVTTSICSSQARTVLLDVGDSQNSSADSSNEHVSSIGVTVVNIGSIHDWRRAFFFPDSDEPPRIFDVLVLDVSSAVGNDLMWTSFCLVREFLSLNEALGGHCRTVLIKSASLNLLAGRLFPSRRFIAMSPDDRRFVRPVPILASVGVDEYRKTIDMVVQPGDAVLEIGCHVGVSTFLLHEKASIRSGGYCIGVDIGTSIVDRARRRFPNVPFAVGDAWKTSGILRIQREYLESMSGGSNNSSSTQRSSGFDVIFVDVGGLSGADGLIDALTLLYTLSSALGPRIMVIKSLCTQRLAAHLMPAWRAKRR